MPQPEESRNAEKFREWDSKAYHRVSNPQLDWGKKVLQRLTLRGDELVIDAGCGTGRLTELLLEMLPRGRVIDADLSQNMLGSARHNLRHKEDQIFWVAADLQYLPFRQAADGIFSTAAFHWVTNHDRLFRSLLTALKPGGWLEAQCGGDQNLRRLFDRANAVMTSGEFARFFQDWVRPWEFATAEQTKRRLESAGFVSISTGLEYAPTHFPDAEKFAEFIGSVVFHQHLKLVPDVGLRKRFIEQLTNLAAKDEPPFVLDYWRLNMSGKRPA